MDDHLQDWRERSGADESRAGTCGHCARAHNDLPPPSAGIRIWNHRLRMLGSCGDALLLCSIEPPYSLFLLPDADGIPGLLRIDHFRRLKASGAAEVLPAEARPGEEPDGRLPKGTTKLLTECAMLNAAQVPNGAKSIAIFLHQHWTPDLISRFGMPDSPHTIRRWRSRGRPEPPV